MIPAIYFLLDELRRRGDVRVLANAKLSYIIHSADDRVEIQRLKFGDIVRGTTRQTPADRYETFIIVSVVR